MSSELAPQGERMWAVAAQLCPYISTFVGPAIMLLLLSGQPFARYHATQALALQVALWVAGIVVGAVGSFTCGLGYLLYLVLLPFVLAPLWGAWKAWQGEWAGYPLVAGMGR